MVNGLNMKRAPTLRWARIRSVRLHAKAGCAYMRAANSMQPFHAKAHKKSQEHIPKNTFLANLMASD
jgi:hypothetical protein